MATTRSFPSFLRGVWTIALLSFKEIIRDRLLYGVLLIALLVTGSSFFMANISLEQNARVLQNIGLASIHLFALFITVFVTTNSISKDFERRALYLLLAKPVSRSQYVLGKYLGMVLLLLATLLILGGLFGLGILAMDRHLLAGILINLGYSLLEITLLIAFAVLFACFTAPLNAALYTVALFIIGHSLDTLKLFVAKAGNPLLSGLTNLCYYLLPNLEKFDVRRAVLYNQPIHAEQVGWSLLYWLVYTAFALFLAVLVMNKREV